MISVCMATFNGGNYIREQLDSILLQLSETDEVIISDDSSNDDTVEKIKEIGDKRIIILHNQSKSLIFNFENAIKHSNGDIIFLSDQDDVWLPNKVKKLSEALEDCSLVFSDAMIVDQDLKIVKESFYDNRTQLTGVLKNIFFNNYFGATMAFKRELIDKALPFPSKIPMHDQWLGVIAEIYYSVKYINEPLIKYRRHFNNYSYCGTKSKNKFFTRIQFRLNMIVSVVKRRYFE